MLDYKDYQLIRSLKESNPEIYSLIKKITNYSLQTASHGCHDLRNHAALISSYCQLLSMTNTNVANDSYFQKITLSTENLIKLFDEIAQFRYSFIIDQISDTNMIALLSDVISYARQKFNNLSINIVTKFVHSLENAIYPCHYEHMRNAILAIIENSIEACPPENIQIFIAADIKDNFFEIVVQDNGPGFSDEMLLNACIPFNTDKKNHAGLGLSLASTVIYKHNGNLKITNTSCGSQITIHLPVTY